MYGADLPTGWFLENAWLIPVIPGIGFFLIILFGKRMPFRGTEFGLGSMAAALVLSVGAAVQWIARVDAADEGAEGLVEAIGGFGQSVLVRASAGGAEPYVEPVIRTWTWWESGPFSFGVGQQIDGFSVMLLFLVAFISLLVQVFSIDYVRGDRRYTHFFAALTLFSAGMLVMVLAENMVQLILGWEIMGLCSFMLIGHWWEEGANSRAALKAFFTVRVGDVGLLVGTAIIFFGANQWAVDNLDSNGFNLQAINAWALSGEASSSVLFWGGVALFIAAIGKSGQFPLHTWLPDAMAGPTPVSSLLHSSTMVVAGVFLVARLFPVFWEGLEFPFGGINLITVIAMITVLMAAALAFVQTDIKKVLAYSTVSQLGMMMLALGAGAWLPAVFHIFTHAFFKCCLFLCAGSVSHSGSHHSFDMKRDMGGLARKMPITTGAWIIASLALAGVFPFAGFFSKDEIIANVGENGYTLFMVLGFVGAFMTAAYMARATYLTFFGEARGAAAGVHHDSHDAHEAEEHALDLIEEHGDHEVHAAHAAHGTHDDHHAGPHESGPLILVPVVILALLSMVAGFLNAVPFGEDFELIKRYVEPRAEAVSMTDAAVGIAGGPGESVRFALPRAGEAGDCGFGEPEPGTVCFFPAVSHAPFKWSKGFLALGVVFAGIAVSWAVSWAVYTRRLRPLAGLTERFAPARWVYTLLWNRFYLDHLYERVVVHGVAHPIAQGAYWVNQHILDRIVNDAGRGSRRAGEFVYRSIDQRVVDGAVNASGFVASESGHALQPVQSGRINQYGALLFGAAAVAAIVLVIINV